MKIGVISDVGDVLYHPPRLGCGEDYDIPAFVETLNGLAIPVVIAQGNCAPQVYEELLEMPVIEDVGGLALMNPGSPAIDARRPTIGPQSHYITRLRIESRGRSALQLSPPVSSRRSFRRAIVSGSSGSRRSASRYACSASVSWPRALRSQPKGPSRDRGLRGVGGALGERLESRADVRLAPARALGSVPRSLSVWIWPDGALASLSWASPYPGPHARIPPEHRPGPGGPLGGFSH
jgi:hypothetical protein